MQLDKIQSFAWIWSVNKALSSGDLDILQGKQWYIGQSAQIADRTAECDDV